MYRCCRGYSKSSDMKTETTDSEKNTKKNISNVLYNSYKIAWRPFLCFVISMGDKKVTG